jgi:thiamine biosynthesis protein ThiI
MFRIAQTIAHRHDCQFLITGENLGQVASQTLHNIFVTSRAVTIPIIRPLIGLDKLDIITLAERIGTYEISIENASHCRAVPRYPAIRANLSMIEALEDRLDIQALVDEALSLSQ